MPNREFNPPFVILLVLMIHGALTSCASAPVTPWEAAPSQAGVEEKSFDALGAPFRIRIWSRNGEAAKTLAAIAATERELRRLTKIVDAHDPESEISRLNRAAAQKPVQVSPELFEILSLGQALWLRSDKIFDMTFAPIQEEVEKHGSDAGLGGSVQEFSSQLSNEIKARVGMQNVILEPTRREVRFSKTAIKLGVLGLARGYVVQKMATTLAAQGLRGFAVITRGVEALSGDALKDPQLMCVESPIDPGKCQYKIEALGAPTRILYLATSASKARPGHVYEPKYGERKARAGAATIAGESGAGVQGAATAISLMDNRRAAAFLAKPGAPAISGVYFESDYSLAVQGTLEPFAQVIIKKMSN